MINRIIAFVAGLLGSILVMMIIEAIGYALFPAPQASEIHDVAKVEDYISQSGIAAMLMVLLAYVLGSFTGGAIIKLVSKEHNKFAAIRLGLVLTFLSLFNLLTYAHPVWFWIASLLSYVPFSLLGFTAIKRNTINSLA